MDLVVFKTACLCSTLNNPYQLIFKKRLFYATGKVLVEGVFFQQRVQTLSIEGEIIW